MKDDEAGTLYGIPTHLRQGEEPTAVFEPTEVGCSFRSVLTLGEIHSICNRFELNPGLVLVSIQRSRCLVQGLGVARSGVKQAGPWAGHRPSSRAAAGGAGPARAAAAGARAANQRAPAERVRHAAEAAEQVCHTVHGAERHRQAAGPAGGRA